VYLSVFALTVTLSIAIVQDAHATSMTFTTSTTISTNQTIATGEVWTVNPGITLTISPGVHLIISNGGSIQNSGTINNNAGTITNSGIIDLSNINSYGLSTFGGTIINNSGGIIDNYGGIDNFWGIIYNINTINNFGNIYNEDTINNLGTINNQCPAYIAQNTPLGNPVNYFPCITTISGRVFSDDNGDGLQNDAELGIPNRTVILVDGNGNRLPDKITDANGVYSFPGIGPGQYLVQTTPVPTNHLPTTGFQSYLRPIISAGSNTTINFPMTPITPPNRATVNGTVFEDTNNNGFQDIGEVGLAGVQVFVVDFLTLTQTTVITDTNGAYNATGILPDAVLVQASPIPAGHVPSIGFTTFTFPTLIKGATTTINFALKPISSSEHGTILIDVFNDANLNGIKDVGEMGVPNATVFTYELLTAKVDVQVTNSTGITTHSGLIPDVVVAQINAYLLPPGFSSITTANEGFEYVPVIPNGITTVQIGLH